MSCKASSVTKYRNLRWKWTRCKKHMTNFMAWVAPSIVNYNRRLRRGWTLIQWNARLVLPSIAIYSGRCTKRKKWWPVLAPDIANCNRKLLWVWTLAKWIEKLDVTKSCDLQWHLAHENYSQLRSWMAPGIERQHHDLRGLMSRSIVIQQWKSCPKCRQI